MKIPKYFLMKKLSIIAVFMTFTVSLLAQSNEIPFTQDHRDRLIRLEDQYHSLRKEIQSLRNEMHSEIQSLHRETQSLHREMNIKFDSIQIQINDIKSFMLWGFGILFGVTITSMIGLVGFVLWDRRTTLAPVVEATKKLAKREILLEKAINGFSKKHPELKKELKLAGIL